MAVRRRVGQNLLKRLDHSFDMPILAEVRFATAAGISSELPLVLGVVQQRTNAQGQIIGVVRIGFDAAFPVDDRFPETALIRINNRQAGGHRFQHYHRLALLLDSWKNKDVGGL